MRAGPGGGRDTGGRKDPRPAGPARPARAPSPAAQSPARSNRRRRGARAGGTRSPRSSSSSGGRALPAPRPAATPTQRDALPAAILARARRCACAPHGGDEPRMRTAPRPWLRHGCACAELGAAAGRSWSGRGAAAGPGDTGQGMRGDTAGDSRALLPAMPSCSEAEQPGLGTLPSALSAPFQGCSSSPLAGEMSDRKGNKGSETRRVQ